MELFEANLQKQSAERWQAVDVCLDGFEKQNIESVVRKFQGQIHSNVYILPKTDEGSRMITQRTDTYLINVAC